MVKNVLIVLKIYNGCNKNASKRAIQKTAEANGNLIDNKIAYKFTSVSTKRNRKSDDANSEIEVPKKRCISPEQRRRIIDELRLV